MQIAMVRLLNIVIDYQNNIYLASWSASAAILSQQHNKYEHIFIVTKYGMTLFFAFYNSYMDKTLVLYMQIYFILPLIMFCVYKSRYWTRDSDGTMGQSNVLLTRSSHITSRNQNIAIFVCCCKIPTVTYMIRELYHTCLT